jgi:hypothetical protein
MFFKEFSKHMNDLLAIKKNADPENLTEEIKK